MLVFKQMLNSLKFCLYVSVLFFSFLSWCPIGTEIMRETTEGYSFLLLCFSVKMSTATGWVLGTSLSSGLIMMYWKHSFSARNQHPVMIVFTKMYNTSVIITARRLVWLRSRMCKQKTQFCVWFYFLPTFRPENQGFVRTAKIAMEEHGVHDIMRQTYARPLCFLGPWWRLIHGFSTKDLGQCFFQQW